MKEIYEDMKNLVDSGKKYRFESIEEKGDENYFEPFEGRPIDVKSELVVEVKKGNSVLNKGDMVSIEPNEFCFNKVTEV